jgi:uncharacterized protein
VTVESDFIPQHACKHCGKLLQPTDVFCGQCGREVVAVQQMSRDDAFTTLSPTLLYYFSTLILLLTYKFTSAFPPAFEGQLIVSIIDIAIVIAFWIYARKELKPLFSFSGFSFRIALLTVAGALVGSVVVTLIADLIHVSISDDVFYDPYLFQDTAFPLLISILFICVQPAIFEEVAFRGFMFTNLEKATSPFGAVYITGFVFGIMHLAFISLIWLVPIGLVFALLRLKYNTLWYGIIGHFTYNLGIILIEFAGGLW